MLNKLLYKITENLPCRIIAMEKGTPYLERYYIGCVLGVSFYLHRFVGVDGDNHVHDHPWSWAKVIILTGYYFEEVVVALDIKEGWISRIVVRSWYNSLDPQTFHRILTTRPGTWTLFFHGERVKTWGFLKKIPEGTKYYQPYDVKENINWWEKVPLGKNSTREKL